MKYTKTIQKTEEKEVQTEWNVGDIVSFKNGDEYVSIKILTIRSFRREKKYLWKALKQGINIFPEIWKKLVWLLPPE